VKEPRYERAQHLGIVFDITPEEIGADKYSDGINVSFRDRATRRVEGYAKYASANWPVSDPSPIWGMAVRHSGVNWWLYFTASEVWATDGNAHYDLTPVGGLNATSPGGWTSTVLNGIPVFNNPQNPPMYWDLNTANPAQVLPGWPANTFCSAMASSKYHLVAMDITEGGQNYSTQLWWSVGAQAGEVPQEWTPAPDNDAGDVVLAATPGRIRGALLMRDALIVYKTDSTYSLTYVAGQYIYALRTLFPAIGAASRHSFAEVNGRHYLFTGEDVVQHDGQVYRSVVDKVAKRAIVECIDPAQMALVSINPRVVDQQVWVNIPTSGGTNLDVAYVIDIDDTLVGRRTLPNVASVNRGIINPTDVLGAWDDIEFNWDTINGVWNEALFSPNSDSLMLTDPVGNNLLAVGIGNTADGEPISAFVEKISAEIGDFSRKKLITRLVPRVEGGEGEVLTFRLGGQDFFGQPVEWNDPIDFTIGETIAISDIVQGRLLSLRVEGTTVQPWELHSYTLLVTEQGEF
jgi:hypothetical protein